MKATFRESLMTGAIVLSTMLSACCGEEVLGIYIDPDDPHFAFYTAITKEMIAAQPEWDPVSQPLPKSIQELSKIALKSFTPSKSQAKTGWTVTSIWLRLVPANGGDDASPPSPALKNRWCCEIFIGAFGDYQGEWWKNRATIDMFLDGTLIKPERRKAPANSQSPKTE
jgi:hypothetical protein